MKVIAGIILFSLSVAAGAAEDSLDVAAAVETFYQVTQPSEKAGGFYALEVPKMRNFSPDVMITVDEECLRFAIVKSSRDKHMCRKHADITKLVIGKYTDKSLYGSHYPGDHGVTLFYKGLGKMAVFDISGDDVDRFVAAVRVLAPSIKKIKDTR